MVVIQNLIMFSHVNNLCKMIELRKPRLPQIYIFFFIDVQMLSSIEFVFSGIFSLHLTKLLASQRPKFKHNCLFTWLLSIFTLNIFFLCQYYLKVDLKHARDKSLFSHLWKTSLPCPPDRIPTGKG